MINVLYEDNHLLVVEKPVNIPVQQDSSRDEDLLTMCKAYIKEKYQKPGDVYLGLVHRLDRPVGGVMVFARTSKAASRLTDQFASHKAKKSYAALTMGRPAAAYQRLEGFIRKDPRTGSGVMTSKNDPEGKRAALEYRVITAKSGMSLLDVSLFTGRHHQIRLQLSDSGLPLWGDQRYNPGAVPGQQVALWAYSLTLTHPTKGEEMTFTSIPKGPAWQPFKTELACLVHGVRLKYADADMICVNKSAGMSVVEEDGGDSLEKALLGVFPEVYPVHRLDVATSGLVLFALNKKAKEALEEAIRLRTVKKFYRCTVHGRPKEAKARLSAYLIKDDEKARVRVTDKPVPGALEIETAYRVTGSALPGTSEVEVELITGRTHQIRAHMAHIGHPLVGDDKYGDRERDRELKVRGLALEAARLELFFPEGSYLEERNNTVIRV